MQSSTVNIRLFSADKPSAAAFLHSAARAIASFAAALRFAAARAVSAAAVIPFEKTATDRAAVNRRAERYMHSYGNSILRLAYSYVHNMADAEDVLQETLIKVLEANPAFENEAHEKAYLYRAAANCAKNRIKENRRRDTDELNEELVAEEKEDLAFVWDAVKHLPQVQREAVHLFYQEGFSTAEIAAILERKEATVRSDLKRAREALKNILKEEYDFG